MPSWLTILVALIAVRLLALEALAERAKRSGDMTLYRAPFGLSLLIAVAIMAMVYGAGSEALAKNLRLDWWVSAILLAMAVFCSSQWPAELGVSKSGIYEKKWLGFQKKSFAWSEVASASMVASEESVWVVTKSGSIIKLTKYHVDRAGFIDQIKIYCPWLESKRAV